MTPTIPTLTEFLGGALIVVALIVLFLLYARERALRIRAEHRVELAHGALRQADRCRAATAGDVTSYADARRKAGA